MIKYCLFFISLLMAFTALAVEVDDLYIANVAVNSQSKSDRAKALRAAFRAVIVKVSGQNAALEDKTLATASRQYNQYLSQFKYQRKDNELRLVATFNEEKIKQLFLQANVALWGSLRPQVLLWLVEEDKLTRRLLSESSFSELPKVIQQFSVQRGLPISLPLVDLVDTEAVQSSDVWGRFALPILDASSRYNAEAVIIMRISNSSLLPELVSEVINEQDCQPLCKNQDNQYLLDWSLITGSDITDQVFGNKYQGVNQVLLMQQALDDITKVISQDYTLSTSINNEFVIDVANVETLSAYVGLSSFLQELSSVQEVTLIKAEGVTRRFKLQLLGSKAAFLSSLKLNKQLQQYIDPLAPVEHDAIPVFYWKQR